MAGDVSRTPLIALDRNIRYFTASVTDQTGHTVNLSTFGNLLSGDIAEERLWIRPIQPAQAQFRTLAYWLSLAFEEDPHGVEAVRKMTRPLTVVCTIFREDGGTDEYELADAWVNSIEGRTIVFWSTNMKQSRT